LSIVFVASEILHRRAGRNGVTERSPWLVAFIFGLLHGFGFAGALSQVGLPSQAIPLALLFFNVGSNWVKSPSSQPCSVAYPSCAGLQCLCRAGRILWHLIRLAAWRAFGSSSASRRSDRTKNMSKFCTPQLWLQVSALQVAAIEQEQTEASGKLELATSAPSACSC
jgi:hypothetical protein